MYLVKIRNGDETTVIHGTKNNTLGDAKVSMTVSAASSFTFIIYPNNTGYFKLREWTTYIDVTQSDKYIFRGRVIAVDPKHNEDGTFYKEITCESAMAYLNDSILSWEKVDKKPADFFGELINEHNKQVVDAEKQFKIAENSVTNNTNNLYCYVEDGISILEEMKNDLLQNEDLGGEISIDYRKDGNYISWTRDKKVKGQQVIKLAKNLKTLSAKPDISKTCSVLYPFGATKEVPVDQKNDEKTNEVSTPRINISSVNNGKNYIEDPELIKVIGRVSNTKTWENIKEPKNLLAKAQEYLKTMRNYRIAYELDAVDLQPLGLAVDSFECGNYYHVINPVINVDEWLRLVGVTINLNKPLESTLTVGDQVKRLVDYSMDNIQTERNLKRLSAEQQVLKHQNNMLIDENNQLKQTIIKLWNDILSKQESNDSSGSAWNWPFKPPATIRFDGAQLFGVNPGGEFRPNGFHDGLDFGSVNWPGSEVKAIHDGTVTLKGAMDGLGNYFVTNGDGFNIVYQEAFGSASDIRVNIGDHVKVGDVVGIRTTDHLHVGVTKHDFNAALGSSFSNNGTWLDPKKLIEDGLKNNMGTTQPVNGDWGPVIRNAAAKMKVNISDNDVNRIKALIANESGGNQTVTQQVWDQNMAAGTPAQGLLQYVPSTFNAYAVDGHRNIKSGFDQLLAFFNNSTWSSDIHIPGWGPNGSKRFDKMPA